MHEPSTYYSTSNGNRVIGSKAAEVAVATSINATSNWLETSSTAQKSAPRKAGIDIIAAVNSGRSVCFYRDVQSKDSGYPHDHENEF
jgi:hypothetical protein